MNQKLLIKISAVISGLSGMVILAGVLLPIITYQPVSSKGQSFLNPIASNSKVDTDYTRASNWFPTARKKEDFSSSKVSFYTLSIPKLKIQDASVAIGGEDLAKSLIQYPGTALPGKRGNAVIFGHSVLPIFFNPKDYISIFSTLPTLKPGDEIDVSYDGISYVYRIEQMFEVLPTDIQVLEQDESDSFLTLVTCVPPGDPRKPRRLIVRARVVPPKGANANSRN